MWWWWFRKGRKGRIPSPQRMGIPSISQSGSDPSPQCFLLAPSRDSYWAPLITCGRVSSRTTQIKSPALVKLPRILEMTAGPCVSGRGKVVENASILAGVRAGPGQRGQKDAQAILVRIGVEGACYWQRWIECLSYYELNSFALST